MFKVLSLAFKLGCRLRFLILEVLHHSCTVLLIPMFEATTLMLHLQRTPLMVLHHIVASILALCPCLKLLPLCCTSRGSH